MTKLGCKISTHCCLVFDQDALVHSNKLKVFSMLPGFSARLMPKGNEKRKPGEDQALHNHDGLKDEMMQIAWGCGRIQEVMEMGVQDAQHRSKALPPKIRGMGGLQNLMKQMGPAKDMMGLFGGGD
ncbi:hypothetical protein Goshw_014660, partial [Gossypium schwendimanii]|nr:hypothetical protein [Gossypium schwendimanii]